MNKDGGKTLIAVVIPIHESRPSAMTNYRFNPQLGIREIEGLGWRKVTHLNQRRLISHPFLQDLCLVRGRVTNTRPTSKVP